MEDYTDLTIEQRLDVIRCESLRIWSYLSEMIDVIENKYYLYEWFDQTELLVYCKSCEESYENIDYMTYELDNELHELTYPNY